MGGGRTAPSARGDGARAGTPGPAAFSTGGPAADDLAAGGGGQAGGAPALGARHLGDDRTAGPDGLHGPGPGGGRGGGAEPPRSTPPHQPVDLRLQREGEFGAGSGAAL